MDRESDLTGEMREIQKQSSKTVASDCFHVPPLKRKTREQAKAAIAEGAGR